MRILIALTYYRPHYSGLTLYAEREARALAARGHQVTILTSRFDDRLPARETIDGVEIIRPKVRLHISKGVIMPSLPALAWPLIRKADVVHLHVPQLDAALISVLARLLGKPVVLTYHCDLLLPGGLVNRIANLVSNLANHITARAASLIVTNTRDYAEQSNFLKRYLHKLKPVYPPVDLAAAGSADMADFKEKIHLRPDEKLIGMVARLATEKGAEYLAAALPLVLEKHPQARVLYVGPYQNVFGEQAYAARLAPQIEALGDHWSFLGVISPVEMTAFFRACDVTVLPSLNSTESYGLVQIESMTCGTPVVASDLPGVRVPVRETGMGKIVPKADAKALAQAIIDLLDHPQDYRGHTNSIVRLSNPDIVAGVYEEIFKQVQGGKPVLSLMEPAEKKNRNHPSID
jgi:glycosyltransferase involved in cell wall biosynthesis